MPNFGPFKTAADAVLAACPLILSKPNAVAGRQSDPNFDLYFRLSTEYCGMVYYTPDRNFEMSMLATEYVQSDPAARHCPYISHVDDPRYPPGSLKYIYLLHNHTYDGELSDADIGIIVDMGLQHGFKVPIEGRTIYIGIIAFFSKGAYDQPSCDGFFQYIPLTTKITKWSRDENGRWEAKDYADVVMTDGLNFKLQRKR